MRATFEAVLPDNLRRAWGFVRPALESMERSDGWLPEDVYMCLRSNGATLYMVYDPTGQQAGFFILRLLPEFDGLRLHIWILHATDAEFDVMAEFGDDLDTLARQSNARRVTFSSPRNGWGKVGPRYGFHARETVYEREVTQ